MRVYAFATVDGLHASEVEVVGCLEGELHLEALVLVGLRLVELPGCIVAGMDEAVVKECVVDVKVL